MRATIGAIALGTAVALGGVGALVLRARLRHVEEHTPAWVSSAAAGAAGAPRVDGSRSYVGVILSERTVDVVTRVDGLVVDLPVKLGQRVVAGELVAKVDVPKLQHELATATAAERGLVVEIARANAEVVESERVVGYKERLLAGGVGSEEEVEAARYQRKVARLRVTQAAAKLDEQRGRVAELQRDLEATKIRAPVDGVVATRYVDPGMTVATLGRVLRIVADGKPMVRFAVPQADLECLSIGADVVATGTASGARIRARVEAISPEVDAAANMLFVEARILDADAASTRWHSGELVHVVRGAGG